MNAGQVYQIEITDPDGNRRTVPGRARTTIGRQVGNDLVLSDQRVSRQHAAIACTDDGCQIADLDSSNGTFLDGEKLPPNVPTPLKPGARVEIGPFSLTLQVQILSPEPAADLAPSPDAQAVHAEPTPGLAAGEELEEEPRAAEAPVRDEPEPPQVPPSPPARPPGAPTPLTPEQMIPPGLGLESRRLIQHLPGIYHTAFMRRFLGIFEAILTPIEWQIDNFDLYLDPGTAPLSFLPWLASWFDVAFDPSWDEVQRRQLLREAHKIYARRGTKWALSRVLEIYTGKTPTIVDEGEDLAPFTFKVSVPLSAARSERAMIERLIDVHKPAYALYELEFIP